MLLYAMAKSGYVGFHDPTSSANGDLYFVARSLAPVAVAYDPVRKVIIIALHAPYTGVYHEFALDAVGCHRGTIGCQKSSGGAS